MILIRTIEQGVATVTLNRPKRKNAIDSAMRTELPQVFAALQDDPEVRAIVLTGADGAFCSGADLGETGGPDNSVARSIARIGLLHRMMRAVTQTEKPVIAAVEGVCVGVGWSMALACDYVIAAADARFSFSFRAVGLAPDGGSVICSPGWLGRCGRRNSSIRAGSSPARKPRRSASRWKRCRGAGAASRDGDGSGSGAGTDVGVDDGQTPVHPGAIANLSRSPNY